MYYYDIFYTCRFSPLSQGCIIKCKKAVHQIHFLQCFVALCILFQEQLEVVRSSCCPCTLGRLAQLHFDNGALLSRSRGLLYFSIYHLFSHTLSKSKASINCQVSTQMKFQIPQSTSLLPDSAAFWRFLLVYNIYACIHMTRQV